MNAQQCRPEALVPWAPFVSTRLWCPDAAAGVCGHRTSSGPAAGGGGGGAARPLLAVLCPQAAGGPGVNEQLPALKQYLGLPVASEPQQGFSGPCSTRYF